MSKSQLRIKFKSTLVTSDRKPVYHYLMVQRETVASFEFKGNLRRVVCTLNFAETFHCSLLPNGKGEFCICPNKTIRDKLGLSVGDSVDVELIKDESKYGMPMPEEFEEVLRQDPDGHRLFHGLTPGKQKTILYYVAKAKDIDRRIHAALVVIEHLKNNDGKIDYHQLYEELKRPIF